MSIVSPYRIVSKKSFVPLICILSVFGFVFSFISTPTVFAAVQTQETTVRALPVARAVAVTPAKAPVKVVAKKVVVLPPKVVPKKVEVRLKIPRIGVNAIVKDMGVTKAGAMAVPANRVDVGWYGLGTRPGEAGSAVIGGHNRWDNGTGVFIRLDRLIQGDTLSVVDAKGVATSFVVRETRTYDAKDANSGIFVSESGVHLNLITCSGVWDPSTKSYTTRLVVFTDAV